MSKKSLTNGVSLKVENRSGFDKSKFWAGTIPVGALVPMVHKLMIPSSGKLRLKLSAQLPPLASDAYLRTHLKVEAFAVPMRLCSGSFESWYCGKEVYDAKNNTFVRADLPAYALPNFPELFSDFGPLSIDEFENFRPEIGSMSLFDYFNVPITHTQAVASPYFYPVDYPQRQSVDYKLESSGTYKALALNIFPFVGYQLIYDYWYRNKFVERPLFSQPSGRPGQSLAIEIDESTDASTLPYIAIANLSKTFYFCDITSKLNGDNISSDQVLPDPAVPGYVSDKLLNGTLHTLRYRNYGDDYFTCATPQAQEGSPVTIDTSNGLTISALRAGNAMQEFRELNNYASPDYVQTNAARYGVFISEGVAQKPVLLGSFDIPMYTSGVEQNAASEVSSGRNPFNSVGARYGSAHAEGNELLCDFDIKEPSYLFAIVSLVPEANYSQGLDREMTLFTDKNDLLDLPLAHFEGLGNEPIYQSELNMSRGDGVFGYVQRFLHHKLGGVNEIHGEYRFDGTLKHFIPQRIIAESPSLSSAFLKVKSSDLDSVLAVNAEYLGVMVDAAIELFVSEPLSESAIPSLVDPAKEHGHSVYVKTGGSKLA